MMATNTTVRLDHIHREKLGEMGLFNLQLSQLWGNSWLCKENTKQDSCRCTAQ